MWEGNYVELWDGKEDGRKEGLAMLVSQGSAASL